MRTPALSFQVCFFFGFASLFNASATTVLYTLSLHDALPISSSGCSPQNAGSDQRNRSAATVRPARRCTNHSPDGPDRKSTRLNSSHSSISYAVFCVKKKFNTSALGCESCNLLIKSKREGSLIDAYTRAFFPSVFLLWLCFSL